MGCDLSSPSHFVRRHRHYQCVDCDIHKTDARRPLIFALTYFVPHGSRLLRAYRERPHHRCVPGSARRFDSSNTIQSPRARTAARHVGLREATRLAERRLHPEGDAGRPHLVRGVRAATLSAGDECSGNVAPSGPSVMNRLGVGVTSAEQAAGRSAIDFKGITAYLPGDPTVRGARTGQTGNTRQKPQRTV